MSDTAVSTSSSQACRACHARKVKCDAYRDGTALQTCSNCQKADVECVPHVRKKRRPRSCDEQDRKKKTPRLMQAVDSPVHQSGSHPSGPSPQSYLGRSEYVPGPIDEEDASRYHQNIGRTRPVEQVDAQRACAELAVPLSMRESLIRSFVAHCLPWMPLLTEAEIRHLHAEQPYSLLMTAVYVAGSRVLASPRAADVGAQCYQRVRILFFNEQESDIMRTIIALTFLQWWNPVGPEHVSVHNSAFWLRTCVALAHQTGLHKEPSPKLSDARLRRVVWWTLVSRDSQIATSHGRPRAINLLDSDVRPLARTDVDGPIDTATLFISYVQITTLLGDLTEHASRGDLGMHNRLAIEEALLRWISDLPPGLHLHDRTTGTMKAYAFDSRHIHVPYFVAIMILFHQKHSDRGPSMPSLVAAGFVSGIFEEYIDWGDIAVLSPPSIFYIFTAALTQLSSHRFTSLATAISAEQDAKVVEIALGECKKRFATAFGAERVVNYTRRVSQNASDAVHLRPVDRTMSQRQLSFFTAFGPGLCRHWSIVEANLTGSTDSTIGHTLGSPNRSSAAMPSYTGPGWPDGIAAFDQISGGDQLDFGFGDLLADDAFSRLWWSDWTTQT